jgi:hypothetical protein
MSENVLASPERMSAKEHMVTPLRPFQHAAKAADRFVVNIQGLPKKYLRKFEIYSQAGPTNCLDNRPRVNCFPSIYWEERDPASVTISTITETDMTCHRGGDCHSCDQD